MNAIKYEDLYQVMFADGYPGHTPAVAEAPNGDGKVDVAKRYSHLARKYMKRWPVPLWVDRYFVQLVQMAQDEACRLGIPTQFWPTEEDSTLRLLEYPPGSTSAEHTDFDLITLNLYRSHPTLIVPQATVHIGELAEVVTKGRLAATVHHVDAHPTQTQRSAVFFGMPPLGAHLPTGQTVLEWLTERKTRSRVYK